MRRREGRCIYWVDHGGPIFGLNLGYLKIPINKCPIINCGTCPHQHGHLVELQGGPPSNKLVYNPHQPVGCIIHKPKRERSYVHQLCAI